MGCPNCTKHAIITCPMVRLLPPCQRCTVWQNGEQVALLLHWPCSSGALARHHRQLLQTCSTGSKGDSATAAPHRHRGTARTAGEQNEKPLYKHQHKECTACERTKHEFAHNLIAMYTYHAKTALDRRAGSSIANSVMLQWQTMRPYLHSALRRNRRLNFSCHLNLSKTTTHSTSLPFAKLVTKIRH